MNSWWLVAYVYVPDPEQAVHACGMQESRGCHENQPCHPVVSNNQRFNDISFVHLYVPSPSLD